jgi:hypothetical protein
MAPMMIRNKEMNKEDRSHVYVAVNWVGVDNTKRKGQIDKYWPDDWFGEEWRLAREALTFILLMCRIGRAPNSIPIYVYPTRCNVTQFIYIWKLLYMFRVVLPPIIRRAYKCIYSIW